MIQSRWPVNGFGIDEMSARTECVAIVMWNRAIITTAAYLFSSLIDLLVLGRPWRRQMSCAEAIRRAAQPCDNRNSMHGGRVLFISGWSMHDNAVLAAAPRYLGRLTVA